MTENEISSTPPDSTPGATAIADVCCWGASAEELESSARQHGASFFGCPATEVQIGDYRARLESGTWRATVPVGRKRAAAS